MLKKRTLQLIRDINNIKATQISSFRGSISGSEVSISEPAWILNTATGKTYLYDISQTVVVPDIATQGAHRYDLIYVTYTGVLKHSLGDEIPTDDYAASMPQIPPNVVEVGLVHVVEGHKEFIDIRSAFKVLPEPVFDDATGTIMFDLRQ